jgi:hypothetical protein
MPLVISFLLFILLIIIGMTIVSMNIWGTYMIEFKEFSDAFLSVLFIHMGLINFDWMQFYNLPWSLAFIIVYCLFVVYILMSTFMVFFIDSYRRVTLQYGLPYGTKIVDSQRYVQNKKDFLRWFFAWAPK